MPNPPRATNKKRPIWATILAVVAVAIGYYLKERSPVPAPPADPSPPARTNRTEPPKSQNPPAGSSPAASGDRNAALLRAIESHGSDVTVQATGRIVKMLPDDNDGDRHQRLLVEVADQRTILIAHNIDLARRIGAEEGDVITFKGQFEWNDRGGVVHWTHHDPANRHPAGWVQVNGQTFD